MELHIQTCDWSCFHIIRQLMDTIEVNNGLDQPTYPRNELFELLPQDVKREKNESSFPYHLKLLCNEKFLKKYGNGSGTTYGLHPDFLNLQKTIKDKIELILSLLRPFLDRRTKELDVTWPQLYEKIDEKSEIDFNFLSLHDPGYIKKSLENVILKETGGRYNFRKDAFFDLRVCKSCWKKIDQDNYFIQIDYFYWLTRFPWNDPVFENELETLLEKTLPSSDIFNDLSPSLQDMVRTVHQRKINKKTGKKMYKPVSLGGLINNSKFQIFKETKENRKDMIKLGMVEKFGLEDFISDLTKLDRLDNDHPSYTFFKSQIEKSLTRTNDTEMKSLFASYFTDMMIIQLLNTEQNISMVHRSCLSLNDPLVHVQSFIKESDLISSLGLMYSPKLGNCEACQLPIQLTLFDNEQVTSLEKKLDLVHYFYLRFDKENIIEQNYRQPSNKKTLIDYNYDYLPQCNWFYLNLKEQEEYGRTLLDYSYPLELYEKRFSWVLPIVQSQGKIFHSFCS